MTSPPRPLALTRIGARYARIPVTVTDDTGAPTEPGDVAVAVLPYRHTPDADTAWTAATLAEGAVRVLLAGPDAGDVENALTVPAPGGDLWIRVRDAPEVDAVAAGQITVR